MRFDIEAGENRPSVLFSEWRQGPLNNVQCQVNIIPVIISELYMGD